LNLRAFTLTAALSLAPLGRAQTAPTIYAQSFRQGSTQIVEQNFEIKLSTHDRDFAARIKDSHGVDRYALSIDPQGPEGDTQITSWQVKLIDLQHRYYDNLLLVARQADDSSAADPKNNLWRLDPSNFARVPANALRVIKVDGFYVVLRMTAHHFTPIDSPYLDSMSVTLELTNTDPRAVENAPK
jgi:hypothetical protein